MIATDPESFSPSSKRIDGTVRTPVRSRWSGACIGGGSSTRLYSMPFRARARSTARHG